MPKKHIKLEQSIIGASSIVGTAMSNGDTFDTLYFKVAKNHAIATISQDFLLLCLDYLYAVGYLVENNGRFYICD